MKPVPGTHISRRTSINLNKFNIGLPKYLCGNHAARPWLGKTRKEKESKQAYHAEQSQQWACGHQQTTILVAKWPKNPRPAAILPRKRRPSSSQTFLLPKNLQEWNQLPQCHTRTERHTWMALAVALKPSVTYCLLYSQITRLCSLKPF